MVHSGSEAEFHDGGAHLLLRTYHSGDQYAYIVQNLHSGMPVAACDERFKTAHEAMRKVEKVAARGVGVDQVSVTWRATKSIVSSTEPSRIVNLRLLDE